MKYIDADKLKEEIQANLAAISFNDDYQEGYEACGMSVLKFIDSLQQEQPEVELEAEIEMQWDSFNKHIVKYDDEPEDVIWLNWNSFVDVVRYFYEFGKVAKEE